MQLPVTKRVGCPVSAPSGGTPDLTNCSAPRSMTRQPMLLYIAGTSVAGYPAPDVNGSIKCGSWF
jgi:hypothetical protein